MFNSVDVKKAEAEEKCSRMLEIFKSRLCEERLALMFRHFPEFRGKSVTKIAEFIGMSRECVSRILTRAKKKLEAKEKR